MKISATITLDDERDLARLADYCARLGVKQSTAIARLVRMGLSRAEATHGYASSPKGRRAAKRGSRRARLKVLTPAALEARRARIRRSDRARRARQKAAKAVKP